MPETTTVDVIKQSTCLRSNVSLYAPIIVTYSLHIMFCFEDIMTLGLPGHSLHVTAHNNTPAIPIYWFREAGLFETVQRDRRK